MNPTLTETQRDELRLSFTTGGFSMEDAMAKLMVYGYEPQVARDLIVVEYKIYKKEMFDRALKRESTGEMRNVMYILVAIVSLIGPVVGILSPIWYMVAVGLCGLGGYLAYKDKPIAGVLAGAVVPIAFIFSYGFYFADRTTYIKIEMAIPMLLAFLPAALIFFIFSKLFYSNTQHEY